VRGEQAQADEPAPVLAHEREVAQVVREQPLAHPRHVSFIGVVAGGSGFVAATEADEVGRDDTVPVGHELRDHLAVEIRPARFAVHAQHDVLGVARALVDVRDAQHGAVLVHVGIAGLEVPVGQVHESFVGGAEYLHVLHPRCNKFRERKRSDGDYSCRFVQICHTVERRRMFRHRVFTQLSTRAATYSRPCRWRNRVRDGGAVMSHYIVVIFRSRYFLDLSNLRCSREP